MKFLALLLVSVVSSSSATHLDGHLLGVYNTSWWTLPLLRKAVELTNFLDDDKRTPTSSSSPTSKKLDSYLKGYEPPRHGEHAVDEDSKAVPRAERVKSENEIAQRLPAWRQPVKSRRTFTDGRSSESVRTKMAMYHDAGLITAPFNQVKEISTKCSSADHMIVSIQFEEPFRGSVYPAGFFSGDCRVEGTGRQWMDVKIPYTSCGTSISNDLKTGTTTYGVTLVVKHDSTSAVHDEWDRGYTVTCQRSARGRVHKVGTDLSVSGVPGRRIDPALPVRPDRHVPECWMAVVTDRDPGGPQARRLTLGSVATIAFGLVGTDDHSTYDLAVRSCRAHGGLHGDFQPVDFIDESGCSANNKLVGPLRRLTPSSGAPERLDRISQNVLAYANFKVFKFPDQRRVYFECNCRVCRGKCPENEEQTTCGRSDRAATVGRRTKRSSSEESDTRLGTEVEVDLPVALAQSDEDEEADPRGRSGFFHNYATLCLPTWLWVVLWLLGCITIISLICGIVFLYIRLKKLRKRLQQEREMHSYSGMPTTLSRGETRDGGTYYGGGGRPDSRDGAGGYYTNGRGGGGGGSGDVYYVGSRGGYEDGGYYNYGRRGKRHDDDEMEARCFPCWCIKCKV